MLKPEGVILNSHPELVSAFGHLELVSGSIVTDAEINSA